MQHQTAIVLTSANIKNTGDPPRVLNLRQAVKEGMRLAAREADKCQSEVYGPCSLTLGTPERGFRDRDQEREVPRPEFWNSSHPVTLETEDIPEAVLWDVVNTTDDLLIKALTRIYETQRPFPSMLLSEKKTLHQLDSPTRDIFGDGEPGQKAHRVLIHRTPGEAHEMAKTPLRQMAKAQFNHDYCVTLAENPGIITVAVSWLIQPAKPPGT